MGGVIVTSLQVRCLLYRKLFLLMNRSIHPPLNQQLCLFYKLFSFLSSLSSLLFPSLFWILDWAVTISAKTLGEKLEEIFSPRKSFSTMESGKWVSHNQFCGHSSLTMEKAMAPHSSTLAWKIPWTEEPGRLQSMGSLRVRHNWATSLSLFTFMHWRRKWQPTPVFLPGESQGRGCRLWGRTESDTTEVT